MNETKPAPDLRKAPVSEIRRVALPSGPKPGAPGPQPAQDPRKASEARRPGSVTPAVPNARPSATPVPAAVEAPEEDPEKLLREYAERQKTKVQRLEQQVGELRKIQAERDALRTKSEVLAKELADARRQLEAAAKADEVIKDLQAKVDAALLSSSMEKDELAKVRARAEALESSVKKAEERAVTAERTLTETIRSLSSQTEGRRDAEARIVAALHALQGEGTSKAATVKVPTEASPGKPHPAAPTAPPRPAVNFVKK